MREGGKRLRPPAPSVWSAGLRVVPKLCRSSAARSSTGSVLPTRQPVDQQSGPGLRPWPVGAWSLGLSPAWFVIVAANLAATAAAAAWVLSSPNTIGGDFHAFYAAGWMFRHAENPYATAALRHVAARVTGDPSLIAPRFVYLPWFGLAMAPLSLLPYKVAFWLWDVLILSTLWATIYGWARSLTWGRPWLAATVVAISASAAVSYLLGQTPIFAVAAMVGGLWALRSGRPFSAGALVAAGALLKPQDMWPLLPLLLVAGQQRGWAFTLRIFIGELVAASVLLLVPEVLVPGVLHDSISGMAGFASQSNTHLMALGVPGWLSLLPANAVPSGALYRGVLIAIAIAGVAAAVAATLYVARASIAKGLPWAQQVDWLVLLPLGVWIMASPYGNPEDVVVFWPLALLALGTGSIPRYRGVLIAFGMSALGALLLITPQYAYPWYSLAAVPLLALLVVAFRSFHDELVGLATVSPPG